MLNVGLGQLLGLTTRDHPARGFKTGMPRRPRRVQMAARRPRRSSWRCGGARRPSDRTDPHRLHRPPGTARRHSAADRPAVERARGRLRRHTPDAGCWYGFGLSLMDGFHSVLLLVDHTGATPRIWWLDEFSRGLDTEVTTTLDAKITTFTQTSWQRVLDTKGKAFSTRSAGGVPQAHQLRSPPVSPASISVVLPASTWATTPRLSVGMSNDLRV